MRCILPMFLLFLAPAFLQAQLKADFTPDKTGGCSPLGVSFINTSGGVSASATYQWDLGNGNTSTLASPSAIYYQEKTYTVTLTVRDGSQASTQSKTITVYNRPSTDFNVTVSKGCIPFTASFASNSLPGDGSITTYHWDFGDGNIQQSSSPAITHTYNFVQMATVSLTAANSYGCSNSIVKERMVTVIPSVTAGFSADKTTLCSAPATVRFSNTSSGPGTLSYAWDFGDGTSSGDASPMHIYAAKGIYTVKLVVTSSDGCVNEITKPSFINVANFTTNFESPAQICAGGLVTFSNLSNPTPDVSTWVVDGTENYPYYYNGVSFTYAFALAGTHTVELVNQFGSCRQNSIKQVEVRSLPGLDGFLVDVTGLCGAPLPVKFKDTTSGAVSWKWNFDYYNNISSVHSTLQAPVHTYTSDNNYYVALTVTNAAGCAATSLKQVAISRPLIGIFMEPGSMEEGCVPVTTKFSARFTEAISSYNWNFGDGATSTDAVPSHTYTQAGVYNVSLHYTTINGCSGTVNYYNTIRVRQKPKADFNVQSLVCGNTPVQFNNTSTGYAPNFIWNFGDGSFNDYRNVHQYLATGEYDVMLIANNGMCNDTIIKPAALKVFPPFASIGGAVNTCQGNRGLVTFTDASREADSWGWDFGDGTSLSYAAPRLNVEHDYTRSGHYKVVLAVTRGSCTVKDSVTVYVLLKQSPRLTANTDAICLDGGSLNIKVDGLSTFELPATYYPPPYYTYQIVKEDGNAFGGYYNNPPGYPLPWTPVLNGFNSGTEKFRVISQSVFYNCYDTTNYISVKIGGPLAALRVNTSMICYKSLAAFDDLSVSQNNTPIIKWEWQFGDGQTLVTSQGGAVTHRYNDPGVYLVTLRVTDANQCSSTFTDYTHPVSVTGPKVSFIPSGFNVQLNTTINFYNSTNIYNTVNPTYTWDFGNSAGSAAFSPSYTYTVPGDYIITLIAENAQTQCRDTVKQTITVRDFNTGFSTNAAFLGDKGNCPPVEVRFNSTSTNYTRLLWDFGDGFSLENNSYPNHIYTRPGKYIVTLYVYGYNGLSDTYKDTILVNRPQASIGADDLEGCIGQSFTLNAPSHTNAVSFLWDFGNGHVQNATDSFAIHHYQDAGAYTASLLVKDAAGCMSSVSLPEKIVIHPNPIVSISPQQPVSCKNGAAQLQASGGTTYSWTPASGLNATGIANPLASPVETTTYAVSATDANGCRGSGAVIVTVPKPFLMNVSPDTEVCRGSSVQLKAGGATTYEWINTTSGLNNIDIPDPMASPRINSRYTVVGYDAYHCYSDTKNINVTVRPLPVVDAGPDLEVAYGSANELKINSSSDVTRWNWAPADFLSCTRCPAPVSRPYSTMDYTVTVYNQYGCSAKDSIRLKATCMDKNVYIPNAFTPNNDGRNDKFVINGYGVSRILSFRIYNRWGEVVFGKKEFLPNDNTAAWDGRFKGMEAPAGVYVYFVEMECGQGEKFERKGTVTLVR